MRERKLVAPAASDLLGPLTRLKAHRKFGRMLTSAHKDLLITLSLDHERELRSALALAKAHFNESHPSVCALVKQVQLASETVRQLITDSGRVAA